MQQPVGKEGASGPVEVLTLESFEPAQSVAPSAREDALRRFGTLLVSPSTSTTTGGTGYVCRATNMTGEVFAVKRPRPLWRNLPNAEAHPMRESTVMALREEYLTQRAIMSLRGFPKPFGYGTAVGDPLIVMEWVEGSTLCSATQALPHDYDNEGSDLGCTGLIVRGIGIATLRALNTAIQLCPGFVHRDISSRNIMLRTNVRTIQSQAASTDFDVCLIDFGSSMVPIVTAPSFTTLTGVWRNGTPEYAPPEMLTWDMHDAERLRRDPRVDVYALCSVLYELYCGHTPYQLKKRRVVSAYLEKVESVPVRLQARQDSDQDLVCAIMDGLAIKQEERPALDVLLKRLESGWGEGGAATIVSPSAYAASMPVSLKTQPGSGISATDDMVHDATMRIVTDNTTSDDEADSGQAGPANVLVGSPLEGEVVSADGVSDEPIDADATLSADVLALSMTAKVGATSAETVPAAVAPAALVPVAAIPLDSADSDLTPEVTLPMVMAPAPATPAPATPAPATPAPAPAGEGAPESSPPKGEVEEPPSEQSSDVQDGTKDAVVVEPKPASRARRIITRRHALQIAGGACTLAAFLVGGYLTGVIPVGSMTLNVDVRSTVDEYSWEELGRIAVAIAATPTNAAARSLACDYHLCQDDGLLDGTQLKTFTLIDGSAAQAQIVGFRHDKKSDSSGYAGITFAVYNCIDMHTVNETTSNVGGWEASEIRYWLNSTVIANFPDDLHAEILAVNKATNNVGLTDDPTSVTSTSDRLWLPSLVELAGGDVEVDEDYADIFMAEGSQYEYYIDTGIRIGEPNTILSKTYNDSPVWWWTRSPYPSNAEYFYGIGYDGSIGQGGSAISEGGIIPWFCL